MLNSIGQTITSVSKGVGQWKKLERPKKASERVIFAFLHLSLSIPLPIGPVAACEEETLRPNQGLVGFL